MAADRTETRKSGPNLRPRLVNVAVVAALIALAAVLVGLHVHSYQRFSPIDEPQHYDYLEKASEGEIVGAGEQLSQDVLRIETCRRLDATFDVHVPKCTDSRRLDPNKFQERGYNTAYIHPPTYYAINGVVGRALGEVLPGDHDLVSTGRAAGALWLAAAVVLLWLLLGEIGARPIARGVLIVLVMTAPTVLHASSTVNPDGTALACGALVLWTVLLWERGRCHWIIPTLAAGLVLGVKVTNAVGVGVAVLYLLLRLLSEVRANRSPSGTQEPAPDAEGDHPVAAVAEATDTKVEQERTRSVKAIIVTIAAIAIAIGVVGVTWLVVSAAVEKVPPDQLPIVYRYKVRSYPMAELGESWRLGISPLRSPYIPTEFYTPRFALLAGLTDLLLIGGAIAGIALSARASRARLVAMAAAVAAVLVAPVFVTFNYFLLGTYTSIPPRYALSVVPGLLVGAAVVLERKVALRVATVFAAFMLVQTVIILV